MAGLPYSTQNARLLYRAIYWAAAKEKEIKKAFSSNPFTECNYYPESGKYAVVNNSDVLQKTIFFDRDGKSKNITIEANAIMWL